MITNLFSTFDPSTNIFNLSLNWLRTLLGLIIIPLSFWFVPNRISIIWINVIKYLFNEFKALNSFNKYNRTILIFISLFSILLFNNILGLIPYIFTSSSHITFSISLALPLWLTYIFYRIAFNTTNILAHIIPQSTPGVLIPFIVIIESIRILIRPLTLAIRLSANIIAGHLLVTLIRNTGITLPTSLVLILITTQTLLLTLEFAVTIIQSYVFSILNNLYYNEAN